MIPNRFFVFLFSFPFLISLFFFFFLSKPVYSENETIISDKFALHKLIRRVAVFPFLSQPHQKEGAMEAWWTVRETLTKGKRFFVAGKDFLERKEVFRAKGRLSPAEAIILSELLEAQMLVTGALDNKGLKLYAYESQRGQVIWSEKVEWDFSIPQKE